jgi:hypothetical protein
MGNDGMIGRQMRPLSAPVGKFALRDSARAERSRAARAHAAAPQPTLTREERLAIWAAALERCGELAQIRRLDAGSDAQRLRRDGSAASVALQDPTLRAAGLRGDTVGETMEFFGLSLAEAHRILCECGAVRVQTGASAAATVRRIARGRRVDRASLQLAAGIVAGLGLLLGVRLVAG